MSQTVRKPLPLSKIKGGEKSYLHKQQKQETKQKNYQAQWSD